MKKTITIGNGDVREDVKIKKGEKIYLIRCEYLGPTNCHRKNGAKSWWIVPAGDFPDGVPTNGGGHKVEGWLGTTDDLYSESLGMFEIVEVEQSKILDPDAYGEHKRRITLVKISA